MPEFQRWTGAVVLAGAVLLAGGTGQAAQRVQASRVGGDIDVYRIDEPTVNQAVTSYPDIRFQAGDVVSVSAGGCVQTGGRGRTWKRYVDPSGPNSARLYHGLIQLPGAARVPLQTMIGQMLRVSAGTLQLGYQDDGYGDNGYTSHDDGTDNQCRGVENAWVLVVVQHSRPAASAQFTPIAPTAGVSGLPILTTDYRSPGYNTSDPKWASNVCHGQRWLSNDPPRYEWTPVYTPNSEYDDDAAGLSGLAFFPQEVGENHGLSGNDVPFTHPFGFDWETFIAPDPAFTGLLAPSNSGKSPSGAPLEGEYLDAAERAAQLGLSAPSGIMGTETDRDLLPLIYRANDLDRVALFGRWIVDCGHDDFHAEIHPPLLFVKAQALPAGASPEAPASGAASVTFSRVVGRPFLVGQEFGDGNLRTHLEKEVAKALSPVPLSNRIEAHPNVYQKPFSGVHVFSYVVRAPVLQPAASGPLSGSQLVCTFHFTVRSGVAVQVTRESADSVRVYISMNPVTYRPAALPVRHDLNVSFSDLKKQNADTADYINGALAAAYITRGPLFGALIGRGILTDRYDAPIAASVHDGEIVSVPVTSLGGQRQFSVDDAQPFPVYGWLKLEWQATRLRPPVRVPINPVPVQPIHR
ncbi:hypothetical protein [Deinococcus ruber]|uniref:Uncharacterized protein n=1 Tax=Deinococcus ruber TaxID=1848197 RepID=A0A918BW99_9DEIO|nr:hypothetical protein [Deinococcus ruber]GGQ94041.1 hypothetical protein GCM10008957_02720 [Deinococcus ruber]